MNGDGQRIDATQQTINEAHTTVSNHQSRLLFRQNAILRQIATGDGLDAILAQICQMVEDHTDGITSVLGYDSTTHQLYPLFVDRIPKQMREACVGLPVGPNNGSCGRAAYYRESVFAADVETDDGWVAYRPLMREVGLRACWSVPILSNQRGEKDHSILGTFGIYFQNPTYPNPEIIDWLNSAAYLTSIAIASDRARDAIIETEQRFRMVMDNIYESIFIHDVDFRVVDVNQKACESLGYSREELIGKSPLDFDVKTSHDLLMRNQERLKTYQHVTFETVYRRKDGSHFPVEVRLNPYHLNGYDGVVALASDITEKLRARDQRLELQRLLLDTQRMTKLGNFEFDVKTNTFTWSHELYQIFGIETGTSIDINLFLNAIVASDRVHVKNVLAGAIEHSTGFEIQTRILTPDGELRTIELRGRIAADKAGRPARVMGACQDVTDRNRANEEINYVSNLLQKIVHSSSDMIFLKDLNDRYLFCSPSLLEYCGVPEDKVIGATAQELFTPEDSEKLRIQDQEVIASGESRNFEFEALSNGHPRFFSTSKSPFVGRDGKVMGVFGITRDLTDRKRVEEDLLRRNQGLTILAETAALLLQSGVEQLQCQLFSGIADHLQCDVCLSFDFQEDALWLRSATGVSEPLLASLQRIPLTQFPIGTAANTSELVHISASELERTPSLQELAAIGVRSLIAIPLILDGQLLGALTFGSTNRDEFDRWEIKFARLVSLLATSAKRRWQQEAELVISERRFRELANAIPELVWITDENGNVVDGNLLASEVVGDFNGEVWSQAIHPDDRDQTTQRWIAAIQSQSPYQQELRVFNRKSKRFEWYLAQAIPSVNEQGIITAWYGTAINIDEIKKTESALRDSEAQLRAIFETSNAGIIEADTTGRILRVNETLCRMFGHSQESILNKDFTELLHPTGDETDIARFETLVSGEVKDYRIDRRYVRPDGRVFDAHISLAVARHENHKPVAIAAVVVDVSAIKQLEEHVRQSQKMEAVGRLAGGIAHDFNNILTVILSTSEMLLLQTKEQPNLTVEIAAIHDSALRAAGLTRQLLAFSRKQLLKPIVINPNEMIRRIEQLLKRAVGDEVKLVMELSDFTPPIIADPSQFQQVLLNLAINARDAMPSGGTLIIRTRPAVAWQGNNPSDSVLPSSNPTTPIEYKNFVEIEFEDSGVGIPADVLPRIFEPFFSTKEVGKGTGLGLAVVHGIVQQSGGQVQAKSVLNQGTTIQILLPSTGLDIDSVAENQPSRTLLQGTGTILVVDDEEAVRKITATILKRCGYEVLVADGPLQAIEIVDNHQGNIDILLTDIVMPNMRGNELAEVLLKRLPSLNVAYMSGFNDQSELLTMHQERFLSKPFSPVGLSSLIREMLLPKK